MQQQQTISQSDCDVRQKVNFIRQLATTSSVAGPRKAAPKPNLYQKKVMVTGGLLPIWSTTAFWIPAKLLHLRSTLSKSMRCTWKLQSLQPALVNKKGPRQCLWPHVAWPTLQKLNKLSYEVLPHLPYSPDPAPTNCHFFRHLDNFLQGKCFHNQQEAENVSQELFKYWSIGFYPTGINKFISHWQKCVDCSGLYFE